MTIGLKKLILLCFRYNFMYYCTSKRSKSKSYLKMPFYCSYPWNIFYFIKMIQTLTVILYNRPKCKLVGQDSNSHLQYEMKTVFKCHSSH